MQNEIWKEIPGYNGRYLVNENGDIYSMFLKRKMKPANRGNGYLFVRLCNHGSMKNVMVHRIVAESFLENPNGLNEVDHVDGNKCNNRYDNLRFVTHKENMNNANTEPKRFDAIKKKQGIPVIAYFGNKKIGEYCCMMDAAKDLGLSCSHIAQHIKGRFSHVKGYVFQKL